MKATLVVASMLTCAAAAIAQTEVRVGPHAFHRRELDNGLRAVAVRDSGAAVSVFMVVGAGQRQETPETTGLAHLTEHAMYAGTAARGLGQHDRLVHAMGGESNAFTRSDYTLFYDHEIPAEKLATVLAMEADRLRGLAFNRSAVLFERERLRREEARTWKRVDAWQQLLESVVYRQHAYRAGVLDANGHTKAPGLGVSVVREFYDRHYQPQHTAVVVVGNIEPSVALDAVERAFGRLPRGPERPRGADEPDVEEPRRHSITVDLPRDRCNLVWVGPAMGHGDRPALALLARVLSRRKTRSGAPVDATAGSRVDRELFQIATAGDDAEAELLALMRSVRDGALDEAEVEQVKAIMADDFVSMPLRARPYFSLAGTFGVHDVTGQLDYLTGFDARVRALDVVTLRDVARRWLDPARCITVEFKSSGIAVMPLPEDPRGLERAAEEASKAGDLERAIAAYTRLLEKGPNRMFRVIYLASRGQIYVKRQDYDGAIADYEAALRVVDYPAVRDLLDEARKLAGRGPASRASSRPASRPGSRTSSQPTTRRSRH